MGYKKILMSVSMIAFVGAIVVGATGAFFSDTETSSGNTFAAGAIDLQIDNESYYNGVFQDGTDETSDLSWELSDLDGHLFFDFDDLKPGDWGEDTISIHVDDNDAWVCADVTLTADEENSITEPEADEGDDDAEGELDDEIYFAWWADDGDNVYESDEQIISQGPLGALEVGETTSVTLADSQMNIWTGQSDDPFVGGTEEPLYVAKYWCMGEMTETPVAPGEHNPTQETGFTCSGESVTNVSQTDSAMLDVSFFAVQSRSNDEFLCSERDFGGGEDQITGTAGTSWAPVESDWIASIRYGNNLEESGDFELALKESGAAIPWDQEGNAWGTSPFSGSFELDYDGTTATLTVDGKVVSSSDMSGADGKIGINIKTNGADGDDGKVTISNVKVDGVSPAGDDSQTTQGSDPSNRGLDHLVLDGVSGPFTLTGDFSFEWGSSPSDEGPAISIEVEDNS